MFGPADGSLMGSRHGANIDDWNMLKVIIGISVVMLGLTGFAIYRF